MLLLCVYAICCLVQDAPPLSRRTFPMFLRVFEHIVRAVKFLHDNGVCHYDIKVTMKRARRTLYFWFTADAQSNHFWFCKFTFCFHSVITFCFAIGQVEGVYSSPATTLCVLLILVYRCWLQGHMRGTFTTGNRIKVEVTIHLLLLLSLFIIIE